MPWYTITVERDGDGPIFTSRFGLVEDADKEKMPIKVAATQLAIAADKE